MCLTRDHLQFLDETNEADYAAERIGYETYVRFQDQHDRCVECPLLDNGRQGDMYEDCRVHFLRFYISAKRDDDRRYQTMREQQDQEKATPDESGAG